MHHARKHYIDLHETLKECVSGQDKVLHAIMVAFHFFISELWPFDFFVCLFCVIFILVHPIAQYQFGIS